MLVFKGLPTRPASIAFSPDGTLLAAGLGDNTVRVWDTLTGAAAGSVTVPPCENSLVPTIHARFTADGRHLITADERMGVAVWTVAGRPIHDLCPRTALCGERNFTVAPDGRAFTTVGSSITALNPVTREGSPIWAVTDGRVNRPLVFEPDGHRLATGVGEVIDLRTREQSGRWCPYETWTHDFDWAAGRPAIAWCYGGATVTVHDPDTAAELTVFKPGLKHTNAVAFTTDGSRLLAGGTDGIRVYDCDTWAEVRVYDFKAGPVHALAVSPDGTRAAAGCGTGRRGKVVVWDLD